MTITNSMEEKKCIIRYRCGHKQMIWIPTAEDSFPFLNDKEHVCPGCQAVELYQQAVEKERHAAMVEKMLPKQLARDAELGYAALEGSHKQISWASNIRKAFFEESLKCGRKSRPKVKAALAYYKEQTSAAHWIQYKDHSFMDLVNLAPQEPFQK